MKKFVTRLAALLVLGTLTACYEARPLPICKFKSGQIVYSVLDDKKGQVTWVGRYRDGCKYSVRFAGNQDNQRSSWDVDVVPYAEIDWMEEFELTDEVSDDRGK